MIERSAKRAVVISAVALSLVGCTAHRQPTTHPAPASTSSSVPSKVPSQTPTSVNPHPTLRPTSVPPKDPHRASSWPIPDQDLTPGSLASGCMPSRPQSDRNVPESEKLLIIDMYHYTGPRGIAYLEFDHRVPFALCGSNDPTNVWPEVIDDAPLSNFVHNRKDQLEAKVFTLVRYDHITFARGQAIFMDDWRHQWCLLVHKAGDGVTCDV